MADANDNEVEDLNALALEFTQMPAGPEKNAFFHANPALHAIFSGLHFPSPLPGPARTGQGGEGEKANGGLADGAVTQKTGVSTT